MQRTTYFNRSHIDTLDKPLITNKRFKQLLEEAERGDKEFVEEMTNRYSLTNEQRMLLNDKLQ
jgi:hypothetical protein